MDIKKPDFTTIDEYIATFSEPVQAILQEMRATIKAAAPDAEEKISYQMPTFTLKGNLVYFGAYKNHIGFYPVPRGVPEFDLELSLYEGSKGTVQFPYAKPLPHALIRRIVQYRAAENLKKAETKSAKRK